MTTPTLGAGACGAGSAGAGVGTPATADAHVRRFLLTASGAQGTAPRVDSRTLDLEIDDDGNVVGADSVDQSVQLILTTRRGSTMDPDFGLRELPRLAVPNLAAIARAYVREALSRLLARRLIELRQVDVQREGSRMSLLVQYVNLTTADDRSVSIPLV